MHQIFTGKGENDVNILNRTLISFNLSINRIGNKRKLKGFGCCVIDTEGRIVD